MTGITVDTANLEEKTRKARRTAGKVAFYGIYAAGAILLIDDVVKKVSNRRNRKSKTTV